MLELREVTCNWRPCGNVLYMCAGCDRGRRYCSDACRDASRRHNQRRARRKYARSDRGRENNCERQRRWRVKEAERKRNGSVFTSRKTCVELDSCTNSPIVSEDTTRSNGTVVAACQREQCHLDSRPVTNTQKSAMGPRPDIKKAGDGEIRRCDLCGCIGRVRHRTAARGRFRGWQNDTLN